MSTQNRPCVIVDGYSSGNLLAPELHRRGFACVHVQSMEHLHEVYRKSFREQDYVRNIKHRGDLEETVEAVRRLDPLCIMVGTEVGVELTDQLAHRLGTTSNDYALTAARRNKFAMGQRVAASGLRSIRQLEARSAEEVLSWSRGWNPGALVLKPVNSAGNDSVFVCRTPEEIREAFGRIHGQTNRLELKNEVVLAQERIEGTNYVVDTVSRAGRHFVSNIWKVVKGHHNGVDFIYEHNALMPFEGEVQRALVPYVFGVLDALGIRNGPGHSEVMVDAEGPVLIETGARVHGGGLAVYIQESIAHSQVELAVDSFVDPEAFDAKTRRPYALLRNLVVFDLISDVHGVLRSWPRVEEVKRLASFHSLKLALQPGEVIQPTIDLFTHPGHGVLMHEDERVLREDYARFRQLEADGFYDVAPL